MVKILVLKYTQMYKFPQNTKITQKMMPEPAHNPPQFKCIRKS